MTRREEATKMWGMFPVGLETPIHIRGIMPKGVRSRSHAIINATVNTRDFPCIEDRQAEAIDIAMRLNDNGYNIYTTVNPVLSSFIGDDGFAVCDHHVACRRLILIDIDRTGSNDGPATDIEIAGASRVADQIAEYLSLKFDPPFRVMSGNGIHLYLPFDDIPNNADSAILCQRILIGLGNKFDTATHKVDQVVFNAGRITKFLGTVARKGVETPDRPFRTAYLL